MYMANQPDTLQKMTDSELVNVDNQKTKGLNYPSKLT